MELTITYIISQIFTIINYTLVASTYYYKNRKTILIINFLSVVAEGCSYLFLQAYTEFAMCIVALIRNLIFVIDERKNHKQDTISKKDIMILITLYGIIIFSVIFTYDGILSLLSVVATMLYTYSVWQKKTKVYKLLGMPIGVLWILYNIFIKSIFGILLESILLLCSITGYILEKKKIEQN